MRQKVAPHFWALFWNLVATYVIPPLLAWFGWWYQGVLKAQQDAGLHVDPLTSLIVSLPTPVVMVGLLLIGIAFSLFIRYLTSRGDAQKAPATVSLPVPQPVDPNADPHVLRTTIAQVRVELNVALKERDELRRQLEAARAHPPIYFYQDVDLPEFDPRRLVLNQTTDRIRALNPFFYDVKKLESAEERLSAAQTQIVNLKKQSEDAVKAGAAKYESQIEAMLLACAEANQERDAAKAELATLKATFQSQVYRLARSLRELADSGDISESEEAFSRITTEWTKLSPLYWAVKRNLENLLTHDHPAMVDLTKTIPLGRDSYTKMAKLLDRLATDVPSGALAIPEPQGEDDTTL
jgi:hypothetical protein